MEYNQGSCPRVMWGTNEPNPSVMGFCAVDRRVLCTWGRTNAREGQLFDVFANGEIAD